MVSSMAYFSLAFLDSWIVFPNLVGDNFLLDWNKEIKKYCFTLSTRTPVTSFTGRNADAFVSFVVVK